MVLEFSGVEYDCDFERIDKDKIFKINLPRTCCDYSTGTGEGVWAYAPEDVYSRLGSKDKFVFVAKILNDSVYYEDLAYECPVLCYHAGEGTRPVAIFEVLLREYGFPISDERLQEIIKMIKNHNQDSL